MAHLVERENERCELAGNPLDWWRSFQQHQASEMLSQIDYEIGQQRGAAVRTI